MIRGDSKVVVSKDDVVSCDLDRDAVLLNLKDGEYHELNSVAASIWNFIQEPRTVDEIRTFVMDRYEEDEAECGRDLHEALEDFLAKGLISIDNDGPNA